ncbi:MAG: undecaprenyl diphosphate synthase family protein, partial [Sphingomonadales bacterium]
ISAEAIERHLDTADLPPLDLLIRTSGEQRLSNFMLWQAAYAELWFTDTLWPDFSAAEFDTAIAEFAQRERRFGGR